MVKRRANHINTKCHVCGRNETSKGFSGAYKWIKYTTDKKGNWDMNGVWDRKSYLCNKCYMNFYHKLPDTNHGIMKKYAQCRTGGLSKDSENGKSLIDEAVIAKILGIVILNIKMDNFKWSIDMEHMKYGKIDVKGSTLQYYHIGYSESERWEFSIRRKIDCDTNFLLGYDNKRENILQMLIIPNEYIFEKENITIVNNAFRTSKYDRFIINDISQYNDVYKNLILYLKDKERFGIEDIKKWLYTKEKNI